MSDTEKENKGFKVTDRRKFTAEGDRRPETDASSPPEVEEKKTNARAEPSASRSAERTARAEPSSSADARPAPPDVGLIDLVSMLANNALVQLGDLPEPVSGERAENLPGAQLMIAFLTMLQEKTKGNLTEEEDRLLDDVLYDLRMRYMAKAKMIKL